MDFLKLISDILFNYSVKVATPPGKATFEQSFTQSSGFTGYKRFPVSFYDYEPAEKGVALFRKANINLSDAIITLKRVKRSDYTFLDVYINKIFIGSVCPWYLDDEDAKFLKNRLYKGKVDKAYIKLEYRNIIHKNGVENREVFYLFLNKRD